MNKNFFRRSAASLALAVMATGAVVVTSTPALATSAPTLTVPHSTPPTSLVIKNIITGSGTVIKTGDVLEVEYELATYSTHKIVQSSWTQAPFYFDYGVDNLIKGWTQGMAGMRVGGEREMTIPPSLGYGATSPGTGVAANDTLIFMINVLAVFTPGTVHDPIPAGVAGKAPTKLFVPSGAAPTNFEVDNLINGTGAEATPGKKVKMQYILMTYSSHKVVQSSWTSTPFPFVIGDFQVVTGFNAGVVGMRVGGRRELVIPPSLGYGASAPGNGIAKNDTLVFIVDLVSVS